MDMRVRKSSVYNGYVAEVSGPGTKPSVIRRWWYIWRDGTKHRSTGNASNDYPGLFVTYAEAQKALDKWKGNQ